MVAKYAALMLLLSSLITAPAAGADELLGDNTEAVSVWAKAKGYAVVESSRGAEGCRGPKRYIEMEKGNVKVFAIYFAPLYQEHSQKVTQVEFEPSAPVSVGQARAWAAQVAPIVGTRPPTQKQQIPPGTGVCDPPNGGFEERYTGDYLVEYHYAPGKGSVERVKIANEGVR